MNSPLPGVPEGHHTVCPYLVVPDAVAVITFLQEAFGGRERYLHRTPEGRVMHAEVTIGDSVVMRGEANETWNGYRAMVHLYVADVDEAFRRAVAAGATVIQEVATQDHGDRSGGVEDPSGTQWWIATRVGEPASDG